MLKTLRIEWWKGLLHQIFMYMVVICGWILAIAICKVYPAAQDIGTMAGRVVSEPFWVPNILIALVGGNLLYRALPTRLASWVWVGPAVLLLCSIVSPHSVWGTSVWDTYFGQNCGADECFSELMITMPFYASVGYSLGALAGGPGNEFE